MRIPKSKSGNSWVQHEFDDDTDPATVFHEIANQFDQDKRFVYRSIKNVQKMMKIEEE